MASFQVESEVAAMEKGCCPLGLGWDEEPPVALAEQRPLPGRTPDMRGLADVWALFAAASRVSSILPVNNHTDGLTEAEKGGQKHSRGQHLRVLAAGA